MSRRRRAVFRAAAVLAATLASAALPSAAQQPRAPATGTAADLALHVCAGGMTSESLVRAALARAKAAVPLNAFITLDEEGALAAARRIDAQAKAHTRCGALAGVPIVVKDNIHVAGLPSSAGTPALKGFVPKADAPVVQRLRDEGAIVIGKTNMHELAFGISGYNAAFHGADVGVRNAYDPSRSAGGSSSGTGASLGARVVVAGLGTDTGGSVRIPCAFNGCASLRPTVGRYSRAGIAPISRTRDTAGPMALAMADVELLDRVITGSPRVNPVPLKQVRLGRVKELMANLDADTKEAFDVALERLQGNGVTVVDVEMPKLMELNASISFPIALYEAYVDMVAYLRNNRTGVTIEALADRIASPDVKGTYQGLVIPRKLPGPNGTVVDARPAYAAAMKNGRPALQALYRQAFEKHRLDALVFPTVPVVAFAATPESSSPPTFMATIQNTDPGSNAGLPGLQVPVAMGSTTKLPIGIELDGPARSDRRLIGIGMSIEAVLGRLPPPAGAVAAAK